MSSIQKATARLILVCFSLLVLGCSGSNRNNPEANLPPIDDSRGRPSQPAPQSTPDRKLMTKKNMVILAGAAALYYMYKKHKSAPAQGDAQSQYYLSKNGRVYYRDTAGRAHWVTPPREGISVPASEASEYQQFQGYNNSSTGRDLVGLPH